MKDWNEEPSLLDDVLKPLLWVACGLLVLCTVCLIIVSIAYFF